MEAKWSSRPSQEMRNQQIISGGEGQAEARSKPGGEGQAAAKPGGVDQLEASQHQQPATAAVHSTTIAQLQAKGSKPASTSLLVHDFSICCYWLIPQFGKGRLCPNSSLGK
jgi:hypothetical protein